MLAAAALTVSLALAACGRQGDPLPPPDPNAPKTAPTSSTENVKSVFEPGGGFSSDKAPPVSAPKKPFILDPLLN